MESYYQKDGSGTNAKSYESERLCKQFKMEKFKVAVGKRIKKSTKMVYVGFSRPRYLLAFAVHEDRYNKYLKELDSEWEVIYI